MWLVRLDAWVTASVLVALMVVAAEIGLWMGRRAATRQGATNTRIDDATAALFGLLLAFTFGAATARYDKRLWLMVEEATAIGDLAGVAAVIAEPERSELKKELVEYIDVRIATSLVGGDLARDAQLVEQARQLQEAMTATATRAVRSNNTPSVHTALVMKLSETTTSFEKRRAALDDHVPPTILVMLLVTAAIGAFSLGRVQGVTHSRQPVPMAIFILLVGLAVYTTLDLDEARKGTVRVPVTALESVRASLQR